MFNDLTESSHVIHADNVKAKWWTQIDGVTQPRNVGELLCLIHSEIDEADTDAYDDKLPHRYGFEVELADTAIRVFDMLGYYQGKGVIDANNLYDAGASYTGFAMQQRGYNHLYADHRREWLMPMHGVTSAAMEHFRKGREVEGCKSLVALLGMIKGSQLAFDIDVDSAIDEKRSYNAQRADHKIEHRQAAGGKQF